MKQVIVANEALRLPRGKLAAQVAHAAVAAFLRAPQADGRRWIAEGMPKVVVRGESAEQLDHLLGEARDAGIPAYLVRDAGLTVLEAGTATCLGIGPATAERIDTITGALKLVR